jgi:hypothetical protein
MKKCVGFLAMQGLPNLVVALTKFLFGGMSNMQFQRMQPGSCTCIHPS